MYHRQTAALTPMFSGPTSSPSLRQLSYLKGLEGVYVSFSIVIRYIHDRGETTLVISIRDRSSRRSDSV